MSHIVRHSKPVPIAEDTLKRREQWRRAAARRWEKVRNDPAAYANKLEKRRELMSQRKANGVGITYRDIANKVHKLPPPEPTEWEDREDSAKGRHMSLRFRSLLQQWWNEIDNLTDPELEVLSNVATA